jgi:hypothetical protein
MSKSIPLSQGKVALVDDADFDRLSAYQWFLSGTGYAAGFVPSGNGRFRLEYMHRFLMQATEGQLVDHINNEPPPYLCELEAGRLIRDAGEAHRVRLSPRC